MNVSIDQHVIEGIVIGLSELVVENGGGAAELYVGKLQNGHFVKIVVLDYETAEQEGGVDVDCDLIVIDVA